MIETKIGSVSVYKAMKFTKKAQSMDRGIEELYSAKDNIWMSKFQ